MSYPIECIFKETLCDPEDCDNYYCEFHPSWNEDLEEED